MATIWEQSKLLKELKILENKEANKKNNFAKNEWEKSGPLPYEGTGEAWVLENNLIKKIEVIYPCKSVHDLKKLLQSCIDAKFVTFKNNWAYRNVNEQISNNPLNEELVEKLSSTENTSNRLIRVSDGEGERLLDWRYFLFHYMAKELPSLVNIIISIVVATLTSSVFWLFIIKHL